MHGLLPLLTLPLLTLASPTPSLFHKLTSTPSKVTVLNSCPYTVYLWSVPQKAGAEEPYEIPTGSYYSETPRILNNSYTGVSLKVAKSTLFSAPTTQFEYTASIGDIWYDISLINCVKGPGGADASACPGHESGLQVVSGNMADGTPCPGFACMAGGDCDKQAYLAAGGTAPVAKCDRTAGVAFELCALAS